jgi:hypothetical protein
MMSRGRAVARLVESSESWRSVHFVAQPVSSADLDRLRSDGYFAARIESGSLESDRRLFVRLADAFGFPADFGHNWDALIDYLADMEWQPARGYVLVVDDAGACGVTETLGRLIEVWLKCAHEWSNEGKPFHLLLALSR